MKSFYFLLIIILFYKNSIAQAEIPLYNGAIPNSKPYPNEEQISYDRDSNLIISKISRPTLTIFLPPKEKRTGAAVVICPGGGYWVTASKHEGTDVAKRFNEMGVAAFVLKYRIPNDLWMVNREIGPLQDAQRAIQIVREDAKKWGIDKNRIGIMGFSAGGHLASTAGTHYQKAYIDNPKNTNLRPDFMILVYAVISFSDSIGHKGSGEQLLGKNPSPEKLREYSNELQVTPNTPPTFLVHAKDDPVKVENSLVFTAALKKNGVPVDMYLYEKGGHGYGMYNKTSNVLWMDKVEEWMKAMKFIPAK
ncbi:MAG: alpha/beta hydrolase [Flavisolibacter sp.]|nr:alpha/beta hydrolase [Flavisolibacter sp.]